MVMVAGTVEIKLGSNPSQYDNAVFIACQAVISILTIWTSGIDYLSIPLLTDWKAWLSTAT
jgi:hypothetical protein